MRPPARLQPQGKPATPLSAKTWARISSSSTARACLSEGEPFKAVSCEDAWRNLIEVYSHSTELISASRGQ